MFQGFRAKRTGFTLVELVVVILILGILAAIAAPRMFDTAGDARQSGTRQSLAVLRNAIELYRAQVGSFPPAATLGTALQPYIKGPFPSVQVGANRNANVVSTSQNPIATAEAGGAGWVYNEATGDISVNETAYLGW